MSSIILHEPGQAQIPAPSADIASGQVLSHAVLGACVKEGLNPTNQIGDPIHVRFEGIVRIPAASGTTFAVGAAVQFANSTGLAVASGDFAVGRAVFAKTSGQTHVDVILNRTSGS